MVEVYNTGNVALTNVRLTAGQGTANCTAATLAPGANVVCKNNAVPRHTVTTADMLAEEWKQTYTASATAAGTTVQASAKLFPVDLREVSIDDEALVWVPSGVFDSSSLVRFRRPAAQARPRSAPRRLAVVEGRSPCRRRLAAGGHCGQNSQGFFARLFYFDPISGKLSTWNSNEARADERSPPPSSTLSLISFATPLPMIRSRPETSWR